MSAISGYPAKHQLLRTTCTSFLCIAALTLAGCKSGGSGGGEGGNVELNGAGSTFVYPLMSRWTSAFAQAHPGTHLNYQSIGSGGGIQQVKAGTVDFGASDSPLSDQQLTGMRPIVQIPESAGPVCITYSLPGLGKPLQLSANTLAGIYLGKITTWQDAAVKADNPGLNLPATKIVVAHRSDGSGTTNAFTTYLSAVSPEWKSRVGLGNAVSWPVGLGGKGSEGVTEQIRQSPGAIGYVELTYAQQNHLPVAAIRNQAGKYVLPTRESTTAAIAASAGALSNDPRVPIVNPPATAADAYPISTLTFLLLPKDGPDQARRAALKQFVAYVITDGQAVAGELQYAPLPDAVKQYDQQQLNLLTAGGQPIR